MAAYRHIHISYWQDPFVLSLTPEEKFFYLYLMTNSKTTQCGIYEISEQIMVIETGYNLETINKLLNKFIKYGKIDYNKKNRELFILNWLKHNKSTSPHVKRCVENELKTVKTNDFIEKYISLSIQYGYSIDTDVQEKEKEKEKNKQKENNKEIESILPIWDNFADMLNLTKVIKLTSKRESALNQRIKEKEFDLHKIMNKIKDSDFLQGKNNRGWKVDFDFVFCSKNNYIKILEGRYDKHDNQVGASGQELRSIIEDRAIREQSGN